MTPNRREFEKQCAFQKFCNRLLTMKRATPMRKFVGAEFGRLLFPTLPCMRNGSFIPSIVFQNEKAEPSYQMAGKEITPKLLLEAIRALPEERRKIVLLYYFRRRND